MSNNKHLEAQLLYDLAKIGIGFQAPDPNNMLDNLYKEYGRAVVKQANETNPYVQEVLAEQIETLINKITEVENVIRKQG